MSKPAQETIPGLSSQSEIRVLHVDDEPEFSELTADLLESEHSEITVKTKTNVEAALDYLESSEIDCIVSDYDMPGMDGLEFLEVIRDEHPDLPFILFTGKGSEEIAAEAISAGVTDYLQKQMGSEQYTVLANRITNAVEQYRTKQQMEETREWYLRILQHSSDYVMIVDGNGVVQHVTPPIERVMGYTPEEVIGNDAFEFVHKNDVEHAIETLSEIITATDEERTVEFRAQHKNGSWRWLEVRGRNLLDNSVIEGVMVNVRDITDRKKREQALSRQKQRLESLTSFLSHDLKNQLNIIDGRLELAMDEYESDQLEVARKTANRMGEMIDNFTELAEKGQIPTNTEEIEIQAIVEECWERLQTDNANLHISDTLTLSGDQERLQSLFENLLANAIEHSNDSVTIRIGPLENRHGFFVADDGPGIDNSDQDENEVFEPGYTTTNDGSGFGLAIVKHISEAHGWSVKLTESKEGGARFEFIDLTDEQEQPRK
ncbi:MAG: PAS domain S-box protein [Halobacteriaceae archaeon]